MATITFKGNTMNLKGKPPAEGAACPAFKLTGNDLSDLNSSDYRGKVLVLSVVPSVDTGVCATQTRTFNKEAAGLSRDVVILTVSLDLPFAQKRFCAAEGIDQVVMGSDYKYHEFAEKFGLLINELGLLARAVIVVDKNGTIIHSQVVPEMTHEPDYKAALDAVKKAV